RCRPTPPPPPCPYTTLFRSPPVDKGVLGQCARHHVLGELLVGGVVLRLGPGLRERLVAAAAEHQRRRVGEFLLLEGPGLRDELEDRKSTRLNSSHVNSSYAV